MLKSSVQRIDQMLWQRGFRAPEIRAILRNQLLITTLSVLAGLALGLVNDWVFWFGVGAVLATFNFYFAASFVQKVVFQPYDRSLMYGLLFRFYGRLGLTGLILFGLIVWLAVPLSALVAGLSTVVTAIAVWGISCFARQNVKEA
ncbi:MAG: ATP synthase subunit I [Pseudomonadota bacterium]